VRSGVHSTRRAGHALTARHGRSAGPHTWV
jgi:hypothetical protein